MRFEKSDDRNEFYRYFAQCLASPKLTSLPANSRKYDPILNALAHKLKAVKGRFEVIDFGCGYGGLIEVLKELDENVLSRMRYVGVDVEEEALVKAAKCAVQNHFVDRVNRFHLLPLDPYFLNGAAFAKFIFVIHVLHEMSSVSLPYVLKALLLRLAPRGKLVIHELEDMSIFPERDFETWTKEELEILFGRIDISEFQVNVTRGKTKKRRIPWVTMEITKIGKDVYLENGISDDTYLDALKRKDLRLYQSILDCEKQGNCDGLTYAYLTKCHSNIQRRKMELEVEIAGRKQQPVPCISCGKGMRSVSKSYGQDKLGGTDPDILIFKVKCDHCDVDYEVERFDFDRLLVVQQHRIGGAYGRKVKDPLTKHSYRTSGYFGERKWWGLADPKTVRMMPEEITSHYIEEAGTLQQ